MLSLPKKNLTFVGLTFSFENRTIPEHHHCPVDVREGLLVEPEVSHPALPPVVQQQVPNPTATFTIRLQAKHLQNVVLQSAVGHFQVGELIEREIDRYIRYLLLIAFFVLILPATSRC